MTRIAYFVYLIIFAIFVKFSVLVEPFLRELPSQAARKKSDAQNYKFWNICSKLKNHKNSQKLCSILDISDDTSFCMNGFAHGCV